MEVDNTESRKKSSYYQKKKSLTFLLFVDFPLTLDNRRQAVVL